MKTEYIVKYGADIESLTSIETFENYTIAKSFMDGLYIKGGVSYYCFEVLTNSKGDVKRSIIWTMLNCESLYRTLKNEGFKPEEIRGKKAK